MFRTAARPLANESSRLTPHRGLAPRALSSRAHPSSGRRPQLLRLRARSSIRDHLPAPDTWLFDIDSRTGSRGDHGDVRNRHSADGSAARPVLRQSARGRRKRGEHPCLRRLRIRRPPLAGVCLLDSRRSRARRGGDGQPDIGRQVGHARAASGRLRARPRLRQPRHRFRRDRSRLRRRGRTAAQLVPISISSTLSPSPDSR